MVVGATVALEEPAVCLGLGAISPTEILRKIGKNLKLYGFLRKLKIF